MDKVFQKRTLKVIGLNKFDPMQFLDRIHNSAIDMELTIIVDVRTEIFLSVSNYATPDKNNAQLKFDLMKNMLDGCSFEETISPVVNPNMNLIHVAGTPLLRPNQMQELVSKLLELEIKSYIFLKLTPIWSEVGGCSFRVSFAVAVLSQSPAEIQVNLKTVKTFIQSIYGHEATYLVLDRKPGRGIKSLLLGNHIYSTHLDLKSTLAFFQLPLTYGIEEVKKMDFPIPTAPFKGIEIGELAEFKISDIDKVRLDPNRLFEHVSCWGSSGCGKTTFLKNLLIRLEGTGVKFCVLDWHNEYRNIASELNGKLGDDFVILNPFLGSLSLNPLELPGGDTKRDILVWERIENFISLIEQTFILGEVQEARLRESLSNLYSANDCPTISDAITMMSETRMKTLTMKLGKFTKGFYGGIFNRRHSSLPFSELKRKNVIIELGQLPGEVRMFFACVFLILWWDHLRVGDLAPNILVLDDFYRYSKLSVIRKMLSEARKFKQGLICSHQGPYQLPQGIREEVVRNTATKIIFRQEQTWDQHIVRDALGGLTKEQLESLSYLDTGQAIVKLPSVKFPMRINTPPPPETKMLEDWEVKRAMRRFIGEPLPAQDVKVEKPFEKRFLEEIHKNPQAPLTEITKALGIMTSRGYALKDRLVREGYLKEEKIRKGLGRPKISFKLTNKGFEYLEMKDEKTPPQHGKSEHVFIIDKIASILKDWHVTVEDSCDLKAEKECYSVAIEVETGKSKDNKQILYNLRRNSDWADRVVIVCPNKKAKLKIEELIRNETTTETTVITYRHIKKLNKILKPQLTMKLLNVFWEQSSVGGRLSTTGLRKLLMNCFNLKNAERWKGRGNYSGKPKYPFWEQSTRAQAQILAILKTHPEGKRVAEEIENSVGLKDS
jgi:hypothetical protein